jgi:hypothetical protein
MVRLAVISSSLLLGQDCCGNGGNYSLWRIWLRNLGFGRRAELFPGGLPVLGIKVEAWRLLGGIERWLFTSWRGGWVLFHIVLLI